MEDSPIYLLGVCDRYSEQISEFGMVTNLARKNLISLGPVFNSYIYPVSLQSFYLVFLLDNNSAYNIEELNVKIQHNSSKKNISDIKITTKTLNEGDRFPSRFTLAAVKPDGVCFEPGLYNVFVNYMEQDILIGEFITYCIPSPSLTPERIKALKGDPNASKSVRVNMKCNKCKDSIGALVSLDGQQDKSIENHIWYTDLPNEFRCSCGNINCSLEYWKKNLHGMLTLKHGFSFPDVDVDIEKAYKKTTLNDIAHKFKIKINEASNEEEIQKFIEAYPMVLSCFDSMFLKPKAPITTKYKCDFAIFNNKGELILIEIETSKMPLFTKHGNNSSKLTHAFNQVENWLREGRKDQWGVINSLGMDDLKPDMVKSIKGVVIAGRSIEKEHVYLERLYSRQDIVFYTYDDLCQSFSGIVSMIDNV